MDKYSHFRTVFNFLSVDPFMSYNHTVFTTGSCFAEVIGRQLQTLKFSTVINPFGTLYHPYALLTLMDYASGDKAFNEDLLSKYDGVWYSWHHHGDFSSTNKADLKRSIENSILLTRASVQKSDVFIFSLGTAWYYQLRSNGGIVSNCHKHPNNSFEKCLSSVQSIEELLQRLVNLVKTINKEAVIVFTVSPVRHLRDGFIENQISKSSLILATHSIVNSNDKTFYFPAYELMLDDLRDYRFYAEDFVHPNELAKNYIWQKFMNWSMDETTQTLVRQVEAIKKAAHHRPFNPDSAAHQVFLKQQTETIKKLQLKHPFLDLSDYYEIFLKRMK